MSDLAALAGLGALLLLPGAAVARAPWSVVPFLSLAFWILSWWLPYGPAGRGLFVQAALVFFLPLFLLRLLRSARPSAPTRDDALVSTAAGLRLLPFGLWAVPPGLDAGFQGLRALLAVWRDGVPVTHQPLVSGLPFAAVPPGFALLVADVSLLSDAAVHRATLLVSLLVLLLLQLALFSWLRAAAPGRPAAVAATLGLAIATGFLGDGAEPELLAASLLLSAAALLRGRRGEPSAVAAGVLAAAAAVCAPALALLSLGVGATVAARVGAGERHRLRLTALAGGIALAVVVGQRGLGLETLTGIGTALRAGAVALLALGLAQVWASRHRRRWRCYAPVLLVVAASVASFAYYRGASRRIPVTWDQIGSMARLAEVSSPLSVVCAPPGGVAAWLPAVAGRAVAAPLLPATVARRHSNPPPPCDLEYP
jgi:hypothetical protein